MARPLKTGTLGVALASVAVAASLSPASSAVHRVSCARTSSGDFGGRDQWPVWSPDGRLLFYREWANAACLVTVDVSGGDVVPLVAGDCLCSPFGDYDWSRDGSRIAFVPWGRRPKSRPLFVIGADGRGRRQISTGPAENVRWSPDGSKIAYVGEGPRDPREEHVWVVGARGGRPHRLAWIGYELEPAWSPDSRQIAFVGCHVLASGFCSRVLGGDIYVIPAVGGRARRLTSDGADISPSWSPSGRSIAFVRGDFEGPVIQQVFVVDANGSSTRKLTRGGDGAWSPAWSPDGMRIAYIDGGSLLRIMNRDGSDSHPLVRNYAALRQTGTEESFAWSYDGRMIAFEHLADDDDARAAGGIYVVRSDGTGLRQITRAQ